MKFNLSKKQKIALAITAFTPAIYAAAGFWLLPGVALSLANKELANYLHGPAALKKIEFNPFTLELTLLGFKAGNNLSVEKMYANLQIDSAWRRQLHLKDVQLNNADIAVEIAKNGDVNLVKMLNLPKSEHKPDNEHTELFPLQIDQVTITSSKVDFKDEKPGEAISAKLDIAKIEAKNVSTLKDQSADIILDISSPQLGKLSLNSKLGLAPLQANGNIKLSQIKLESIWPYVAQFLPLELESGEASVASRFEFKLEPKLSLALQDSKISLKQLALQDKDKQPLLKLGKLSLSKINFDLEKQRVEIGKLRSQQLEAWASREANGELNWQTLLSPKTNADEKPTETKSESKWHVILADTQLKDYRAHLTDKAASEPVNLQIGPLNLQAGEFDSKTLKPVQLSLDTGIGEQGKLNLAGTITPEPLAANLKLNTQDLDLRIAQAYITPFVYLKINSGALTSNLTLDLRTTSPLDFSVNGTVDINELQTLDTLKNRDLLKWQQLHVDGLNYKHNDSLNIAKVTLNEPYARFIIAEDRSTNVGDLQKGKTNPDAATTPAGSTKDKATSAAATAESQKSTDTPAKPLAIKISNVTIVDGSAYFADQSLTPNFKTTMQQLNGQLSNLDNTQSLATPIDFTGRVDRYAPVEINGAANLFDPLQKLDLTAKFHHIELTTLSPYSGKFAGYKIHKGKLNMDLRYQVEKRELKAQNNVVLEQLQLGERVDSPDAVDLPIKLALALMKDSEGKITVDIPIQGNLDNPQFQVGPAIWQTLRSLVLKVVKSPFTMIANMMGGDNKELPDLSKVQFAPGSDQIESKSQESLSTLASALKDRPSLRLDVEGVSHKSQDAPLVAQQQLELAYQKAYYLSLQQHGQKVPAKAELLTVPVEQKFALLESVYQSNLKTNIPAEWKSLDKVSKDKKMTDALLAKWTGDEVLLRKLAQKRAASIKDFMVQTGKLSEARIYLVDVNVMENTADKPINAILHLDSD